ncbi:MAG: DASS family sodium-coupled anion symporter [Myxococcales bacterium]|nr:DASS family sodium-coupled anion symporter [Myxococcales bacterium]
MAWRRFGLVLGPLVFAAVALIPSGLHRIEGMGDRPAYAAAVAALMAIWWFTEAVPIALTACLPLLLYPLLGVFGAGRGGDLTRSAAPYADAYVFLFMGGMLIGAAMEQCGLHRRVALHIMRAIGTEPRRLLLGMLVATAAVSMWISNTATAVMMLPIGMALLSELEAAGGGKRLSHFGCAVMLSVAYAANVGGIGTKIGTGTNSVFAGFLSEKLGYDLGFLRYMAVGAPFVVLFLPVVWWVLWRVGRQDAPEGARGRDVLDRALSELGPMKGRERAVAAVFLSAAALWIAGEPIRGALLPHAMRLLDGFRLQGKHWEAAVALLAALVLLSSGTLTLRALRKVPWGTLVLLGGSFALAAGIEGSGLSAWLALKLSPVAALPLWAQLFLASGATVALSAVASNTATINVMLNLLPRSVPVLAASALGASCDFALPAGTPPNAIVFGSGYVRLPIMMRVGVVLDALAVAAIGTFTFVYVRWVL